jgi:SET domain-containing protein
MTPEYLNRTVWATLNGSSIQGVGVFAIRDIPKGTPITDYTVHNIQDIRHFSLSKEDFDKILPEIKTLILDRTVYPEGTEKYNFYSPNNNYTLTSFYNHSKEPNCDSLFATRDIKKGEEILIDYTKFFKFNEDTINHMRGVL